MGIILIGLVLAGIGYFLYCVATDIYDGGPDGEGKED